MPMINRNLKQERKTAIARGETGVGSKSADATRHRARRKVVNKLGEAAVAGKDVDHKKALKSGGSNDLSNLKVRSVSANRSAGGKAGSSTKKAVGGRKGGLSKK
jgi:hypothetical protein